MSEQVHTVRLEPVGIEMEVMEGETVLDAAFRQGIALAHGCKEGQCSSCKSIVTDGIDDIELLKYSTFALSEGERDTDHVLLCRTHVFADVTIELLNFDEDLLARSIAVRDFAGKVVKVEPLTHDIRLLEVEVDKPMKYWVRPIRRPQDRRVWDDARVLDEQSFRRLEQAKFHHQEVS